MFMTKRLFIAIKYKPDNKVLDLIKEFKICLEDDNIKWVDTDNMHLTMKFYGDTDIDKIPDLILKLQEAAENNKALTLSVEKTDAFYRGKFPSVLFLKLIKNDELLKLGNTISELSKICGFPKDTRPFKAHITLARIKYINDLQLFNDLITTKVNQSFNANSFLLLESKLTPNGPLYSVVKEFTLK